jgi:predicted homoserine dehydrogenase-like protein
LAHNVKLLRDIPADRIITWPDVAMADTDAVRARREMERRFSPLSVATTTLAAK